jgi:transposase-like protein
MKKRKINSKSKQTAMREKKMGLSEWSVGERSEPKRNGERPILENFETPRQSAQNQEVLAKPKRRKFNASYKAEIVQEADRCTEPGQIGALLRREGLYSSQLTEWRKQYRESARAGLQETRRGRKPKHSTHEKEIERLQKENKRLEERLEQAETIIDIQKKISKLLGIKQPDLKIEEDD